MPEVKEREDLNVDILHATEEDLPEILELYELGRRKMQEAGNPDQWPEGYPGEEMLREDILKQQLYKAVTGDEIIGVLALVEGPEEDYANLDGEWLNEEPYLAIHRIVSTRGASREIFRWAMEKSHSLRIDTHADNAPMRHVLEREGFTYVGEITLRDGSLRRGYHKVR